MFVSPLVILDTETARVPRRSVRPQPAALASPLVVGWLVLGGIILLSLPPARGGPMFGSTVPFWLVGAPLVDLLWIWRHRIKAVAAIAGRRVAYGSRYGGRAR